METREKFEALPHIKDKLDSIYYCEDIECYTEKKGYKFCSISSWVNGAWHAFQEQQKIINMQECGANQIIEILNDFESSEKPASFYLRKIKELLK